MTGFGRVACYTALFSIAAVEAIPAAASGQQLPPAVELVLPDCEPRPFLTETTVEQLRIELATDGVHELRVVPRLGDELSVAAVELAATCLDARLAISVDDPLTDRRIVRELDLSSVPDASRARTVALGVAELVRSLSDAAHEVQEPTPPRELVASHAAPERASAALALDAPARSVASNDSSSAPEGEAPATSPPSAPPPTAAVSGAVSGFPSGGLVLFGGDLRVTFPLGDLITLRVGGYFEYGETANPLGTIAAWAGGGAAGLGVAFRGNGFSLEPSAELVLGWGEFSGRRSTGPGGGSGGEVLASLRGGVDLNVSFDPSWFIRAGLRLGYVLSEVRARVSDEQVAGMTGAHLGGTLGLGFVL